jgi:hypothetical protein
MAEPERLTFAIMLKTGEPVTVTVERERSETLAAYGFPAERNVYVTAWNDHQDDTEQPSDR